MNGERILIVDDNRDLRETLARELRRCGYTAFVAADGAEALEILREGGVSAIISDYDMPEMNGLRLLQHVRISYPRVFRVLLTGQNDVTIAMAALNEGGAHRFLLKPWDRVDLAGILRLGLRTTATVEAVR